MASIKNVLVPVDLSPFSVPMLKLSKMISEESDAELRVVNIVEELMVRTFKQLDSAYYEGFEEKSTSILNDLLQESGAANAKHTSEVVLGVPFMEILAKSNENTPAELIVLGGMPSGGPYNLGRNAFSVVRMAPAHTLTVRKKAGRQTNGHIPMEKILVAVDFSAHSLDALDYGILLKKAFKANLKVLQIVAEKDVTTIDDLKSKLKRHIPTDQYDAIDEVSVMVSNDAAREILACSADDDNDLLVLGSHSKQRYFKNMFLGKVAYDVVRKARCSVMVVKPQLEN
jgi:nucleotide-binding universal stress UspA family protein